MSDKTPKLSTSEPANSEAAMTKTPPDKKSSKNWLLLILLMVVIGGIGALGWFVEQNTQQVQDIIATQNHYVEQPQLAQLQMTVDNLNEVVQQQQQQLQHASQLLNTLAQNTQQVDEDWLAAKLDYLITMSFWSLQFSSDRQLAVQQLQAAKVILDRLTDPKWLVLKQAVAEDLSLLQSATSVDSEQLFIRLNTLGAHIDKAMIAVYRSVHSPEPADVNEPLNVDTSTLKHALQATWEELKHLISIRHYDDNIPLLVNESEIMLIKEQVKLSIAQAQLAILRQDNVIYLASLQKALHVVGRYFLATDTNTMALTTELQQLQQMHLVSELPKMDVTIGVLHNIQLSC